MLDADGSQDATNQNSLYDSYIRAFRWAPNRIGEQGLVCYVTNAGWLDGNTMDGLRKCFQKEFSNIYVYNLHGNQRTKGEESRPEGGKIFGSGSRTPVAITILVKAPAHDSPARIHYHDIGDYLSEGENKALIAGAGDINGIEWDDIKPNADNDWINQRSEDFGTLMPIAEDGSIFETYQRGVETSRDAWACNYDRAALLDRLPRMVDVYSTEMKRVVPLVEAESGNAADHHDQPCNHEDCRRVAALEARQVITHHGANRCSGATGD